MELIADRFAVDDRGHAIDLATAERVCLRSSTAGGPTEQARWAERCAWFSRVTQPSLAPLLDYGALGETKRFEAWAMQPEWRGGSSAAEQALSRSERFLAANARVPIARTAAQVGSRAGRPVVVPDADAGVPLDNAQNPDRRGECCSLIKEASSTDDRELLGLTGAPERRLLPVAEILAGHVSSRVVAIALWTTDGAGIRDGVRELARAARIAGCIPIATSLFNSKVRELLLGRTLVLLAGDDVDGGWRSVVEATLDTPKPHIVLFAGGMAVARVHTICLERVSADALIASVCPAAVARRHMRHVSTAVRRSQGLRARFEQLLFGSSGAAIPGVAPGPPVAGRQVRAAERPARAGTYETARERGASAATRGVHALEDGDERARSWPAPGEITRLRNQLDSARRLLSSGRHKPGERVARQAMHALARRGEWTAAWDGAAVLARSLLQRGRLADGDAVLDCARPWLTQARDLRALQDLAIMRAGVRTEGGRLAEAEALIETVLASSVSAGAGVPVDATLALVRCLNWQGRFPEALQRLALVHPEAEAVPRDAVRVRLARSRAWLGRGRVADAVADAAGARDIAAELDDPALCGAAWYACALAQLAAGDAVQADVAAAFAVGRARRAHDPLLAICARVLRAEIARRRGQFGPAALLVKRIGTMPASALPATVRGRVDLLRDALNEADPIEAAERRADATGLFALRLFAPARPSTPAWSTPAAEEVVELMRCCQVAEEDTAVMAAVCARLRGWLRAGGVAFFGLDRADVTSVASEGTRCETSSARRVLTANQLVLPHHGGERVEAGVPVRYAGQVVGALVVTWPPASTWPGSDVSILLSTGATAAGPALSALMTRRSADRVSRTSELLGVSPAIAELRASIEKAAAAPFAVLVEGESGSGKELAARMLHKLGSRRDRPFCTLNCAALPEDLVESELFGHARGAFTGAIGERKGVFEEAHTGTLFLDEIGELSARAQAKLLRAIQEGEIRRVGENACRRVDVRLVTATNRNLRAEAVAGRFRTDLLYRLDVIRIGLPPLRDRRDDIPVLAEHFWREATERVGSRAALSSATLSGLARYDWPGNIRELQNVLASLAVRSPKRGVVPPSALPPQFGERQLAGSFKLESARRTFDRAFVRAALVRAGGQRSRAAEELGVSRQGLAKLITRLEIEDGVQA